MENLTGSYLGTTKFGNNIDVKPITYLGKCNNF